MNAKKQLKAKVFYEDRHVHSLRYHTISKECSHCYFKAKVIPSLPTDLKKKDYETWACLSKVTGQVHAAGCQCVAGEGESCNHIAALLYALVDVANKTQEGLDAPTSSKCKWNQLRKLSPKMLEHVVFKKIKVEESTVPVSSTSLQQNSCKENRFEQAKPLDVNVLCKKLKQCAPRAAIHLSQSSCLQKPKEELPFLHKFDFMFSDKTDLNLEYYNKYFSNYFNSLKCDVDDCLLVEKLTRGQSNSVFWKEARFGRLTSSNFGLICRKKDETHPESLLKTVLGYRTFDSNATHWGRTHEAEAAARRFYVKENQKQHPGLTVCTNGLILNPDYPYLDTSPDGLVHCCENCSQRKGLLEIKCPYKFRNISPVEACADKLFCCSLIDGKVKLKEKHTYYYQIQGQMGLTVIRWCDFFVWTLKGHTVERVPFDEEFWNSMLVKLRSFYKTYLLPELFSERVKRGKTLF